VTESEVHEAIAMILRRFPEFPEDQHRVWVESLALADADDVFAAVKIWCQSRTVWPFVVEITEMAIRMTRGMESGRRAMWVAYSDECRRAGREPTAEYLRPAGVSS